MPESPKSPRLCPLDDNGECAAETPQQSGALGPVHLDETLARIVHIPRDRTTAFAQGDVKSLFSVTQLLQSGWSVARLDKAQGGASRIAEIAGKIGGKKSDERRYIGYVAITLSQLKAACVQRKKNNLLCVIADGAGYPEHANLLASSRERLILNSLRNHIIANLIYHLDN